MDHDYLILFNKASHAYFQPPIEDRNGKTSKCMKKPILLSITPKRSISDLGDHMRERRYGTITQSVCSKKYLRPAT